MYGMLAESFSAEIGNWGTLLLSSAAIFVAAVVRGFAGFGFSLISITAISLLLPVVQIVPTIFLMEILASINLLPSIWRDIDWRSLRWVLLGYIAGLPVGVQVLVSLPQAPAQVALGLVVISAAAMMLRGFRMARQPGPSASTGIGAASGLLNGAFGVGGPPVVLFYFSAPGAAAIGRASLIFYFMCTDLLGVSYFATQGLLTTQNLVRLAFWLPALLAGVWLGMRIFKRASEQAFRVWVLRILIGLAALVMANGLAALTD